MKKKIAIALVLMFTVLTFAACGGDTGRFIMATGGVAGTYYPLGGVMAGVINANTDLEITPVASGASADNLRQLGEGFAHIAIVQNDVMAYAYYGIETWADDDAVTNITTLMSLYPETVQVVVLADSDIYSVEDLAGQRVSVGAVGSGVEANAKQVLAAHGLSFNDITVTNLGFAESADAMRDLNLDAFFVTAATPNTAVSELATARDLRLLNLADDKIGELMERHPFYVRVTVTDADYTWITEPVNTVAVQATLIATSDLDDTAAYQIVQTMIDHADEVEAGHARGAYFTLENAVQSISVDFHPGARKFFEERGALN